MKRAILYASLTVATLALAHPLWRVVTDGLRWEFVANTLTMVFLVVVIVLAVRHLNVSRVSMVVTAVILLRLVFVLAIAGILCWRLFLASQHVSAQLGVGDDDYHVFAVSKSAASTLRESVVEVVALSVACTLLIIDRRRMRPAP